MKNKYKLSNKDQAKAFVFYQTKELIRHLEDVIGCRQDIRKVCKDWGLDMEMFIGENMFNTLLDRVVRENKEKYDIWVEVVEPDGLNVLCLE